MKKRIVTVVCIMMTFMLVACGAKESEDSGKGGKIEKDDSEVQVLTLETKVDNYLNGVVEDSIVNKYDENGNKVEIIRYYYGESGVITSREERKYNEDSKQVETIHYDNNGAISSRAENKYDKEGKQTQHICYGKAGNSFVMSEYRYDENDNMVKAIIYNEDGTIQEENEHEYDNNGNILRTLTHTNDGKIYCSYEYKYDENGNKITITSYNSDGTFLCEDRYDETGKKIERKFYSSRTEYKYDVQGNEIEEIYYDASGAISSVLYMEYDEKGNITKSEKKSMNGTSDSHLYEWKYIYDENGYAISSEMFKDGVLMCYTEYITIEVKK